MIRVVVQNENGIEVSQGVNISVDFSACHGDSRFSCLRFIDPYGDTVFNRMQLVPLMDDLQLLRKIGMATQYEIVISQIEKLIKQAQAEPHLFLKFIGD